MKKNKVEEEKKITALSLLERRVCPWPDSCRGGEGRGGEKNRLCATKKKPGLALLCYKKKEEERIFHLPTTLY